MTRTRFMPPNTLGGSLRLPATPGAGEDGQVLAWDQIAGQFEFMPLGGSVSTGRCAIVRGTGLTLGAYELVPILEGAGDLHLRLARRLTFPMDRVVGVASPEFGWIWLNLARVSASDEQTTTPGAWTLDHDNVSTNWNVVTQTTPFRHEVYTRAAGGHMEIIARIACDADANSEGAYLCVCNPGARGTYMRIGPGFHAAYGGLTIQANSASADQHTPMTAGERDNGIWVRIVIWGRSCQASYSKANQATPPTSWTVLKTHENLWGADLTSFEAGVCVRTLNAAGNMTSTVKYFDDRLMRGSPYDAENALWPATQFDQTSPVIQLLTDYDMGAACTPDQAKIRQLLADAENRLRGDAGAWTYSFVCAAAPGAAPGAYQAAGALVVGGAPDRYWNLWAKCTSNGEQPGSLVLPRLVLPSA